MLGVPEDWVADDPSVFIYIDAANSVEKIRVPGSIVEINKNWQRVKVHAFKSEEIFNTVSVRASQIGMKVND